MKTSRFIQGLILLVVFLISCALFLSRGGSGDSNGDQGSEYVPPSP